jgi:hypothetical protein
VKTQRRRLQAQLQNLKLGGWIRLKTRQQRFKLMADPNQLEEESRLDGCYVVESDLKAEQAPAQVIHDRYKDLKLVERDFRTLKTGHLEFRPWFVRTQENTHAHALTSMLALKVRRHLEQAWWPLEVTVEEGLRLLETWCVIELVHADGQVVAWRVPEPSTSQQELLDALKLTPPSELTQPKVSVVTRKKINKVRKPLVK